MAAYLQIAIFVGLIGAPVILLLVMLSPGAADLVTGGHGASRLILLFSGVALFGAGWVMARAAGGRPVLLALGMGGLIAALFVLPSLALRGDWVLHLQLLALCLIVPVAGAWIAARPAEPKGLPPLMRAVGATWGYCLLLWGALVLISAVLVLSISQAGLKPGQAALRHGDYEFSRESARLIALAVGCTLVALGAYLVVRIRGWRKGLVAHWAPYAVLSFLLAYCGLFLHKERLNRPRPERMLKLVEAHNERARAVPQNENGAPLYARAAQELGSPYTGPRYLDDLWTDPESTGWNAWLAENADALSLAVEASKRKSIFFELHASADTHPELDLLDIAGPIPEPSALADGLCAQAIRQARNGDLAGAADHLSAAYRLGSSPGLRALLGSSSIQIRGRTLLTAGVMVRNAELTADGLLTLEGMLASWSRTPYFTMAEFRWAMRLEQANVLEQVWQSWRHEDLGTCLTTIAVLHRPSVTRLCDATLERVLEPDSFRAILRRDEEESSRAFVAMWSPQPGQGVVERSGSILYQMTMPSVGLVRVGWQHQAGLGILRSYVAAMRYQADRGALPGGWDDLVPAYLPEVVQDPYAKGQPLRFKREAGRIVIYSVSEDMADGGGSGGLFESDTPAETAPAQPEPNDDFGMALPAGAP